MTRTTDVTFSDELLLRQYVLGSLSGEAVERLEDRFFRDDHFLEQIEAVEADIVDDYAAGRLPSSERALFEKRLDQSESLRGRLAFAEALSARLAAEGRRSPSALRGRWVWYSAAAAIVLLATATVWLVQPRSDVSETASREIPAAVKTTPATETAPALGPPPQQSRTPKIVTLVLFGGLVRDTSRRPTVAIPPDADNVRLEIALEEADLFPAYRLQVTNSAGHVVWRADAVQASSTPAGRVVVGAVAADALPAGTYRVLVQGQRADLPREDLARYEFVVSR